MTPRTFAVGLMSAPEAEWLLPAAVDLVARTPGAHLIGVHPVDAYVPYTGLEAGIAGMASPLFLDWQIEETEAIRARFDAATQGQGIVAEWRSQTIGQSGVEDFLLDSLRAADLVLLGQPDAGAARSIEGRLQEQAIRQSGRPVLYIPRGAETARPFRRLLVGWSNTREAARAAHDALALAEPGAEVDILHIGAEGDAADGRTDMAAAIDRLGFKTTLLHRPRGEGVAETLIQTAFERGADLIVSGAFGHSRAYDFVIGAVTRDLMKATKLPVLFSK